jgi:hypothetical protein
MEGWQSSAALNLAHDGVGLQLSGGVNMAESFRGAQVGVVNVAGAVDGLRLGVVNVAKQTRGFGLGVVNVTDHEDGESFAIINLVGNGIHDVAVYGTDVLLSNLAVKFGSRHLYTTFSLGFQPGTAVADGGGPLHLDSGNRRWGFGGGLGWRQPLSDGFLHMLEIEAVTTNVQPELTGPGNDVDFTIPGKHLMLNTLRAQLGLRLAPHVALLAGVGANVLVAQENADFTGPFSSWGQRYQSGGTTVRIYPGFLLGLQI